MVDSQDGSLRVRLFIFSGRPDPEWSLTGQAAADQAQRVRRTIGGEEIYPSAPAGLGYRGFLVRTGGPDAGVPRELTVFRGVVTEQPGPRARHWRDVAGAARILASNRDHRRDEDLLLHICLLRPYVPFIPLEGPQANLFFPGGKDSPPQ
jgi:hypothetical protein